MPITADPYSRPANTRDMPAVTTIQPAADHGAHLALAARAAMDQRYTEWRVLREQAKTYTLYVATILMIILAITIGTIGVRLLMLMH